MLDKKGRELIKIETIYPPVKRGIPKGFSTKTFFLKCQGCKKEFSIPLKRYNQGIGKTCSKKCLGLAYLGKNNPNYKHGLRARRVASSRRKRLINKVGKCQNCGFKKFKDCLEVDHINPISNGGGANVENLRILCSICHRYVTSHGKLPEINMSNV